SLERHRVRPGVCVRGRAGTCFLMRVLITGAGGFVGGHLVDYCSAQGADVAGPTRQEVDLLDADAVRSLVARVQPERVFHLAAEASVSRSWDTPAMVVEHNVSTTLNLLEAVRAEAPEATVLVSCSGEEYGPPEEVPVRENHPLRPQNPYA